jgi:hypothetical protein
MASTDCTNKKIPCSLRAGSRENLECIQIIQYQDLGRQTTKKERPLRHPFLEISGKTLTLAKVATKVVAKPKVQTVNQCKCSCSISLPLTHAQVC